MSFLCVPLPDAGSGLKEETLLTLVNSVGTGNPTHCGTVADPVTAGAGSKGVPKNS